MQCPAVILVRPQLVENIGTTARAMLNCNLTELRIVNPRDPWPLASPQKERCEAAASGATSVLENATIYATTEAAVADLTGIYATSARPRDMVKPVMTPRAAVTETATRLRAGEKIGLLFGPERTGLTNDDLLVCEKLVNIPANPEFSSFNLAQAVLILAYEWLTHENTAPAENTDYGKSRPATRDELFHFFDHLERELDLGGFFTTEAMKPTMVQNLRNAILRANLSEQEVRTWHGMIAALVKPADKKKAG